MHGYNMEEAKRCLKCKNAKCSQFCPVHTDIPTVMKLYEEGKLDEAGEMLFENNPLSLICSIICPHDRNCYGHCLRGIKDNPVKWYDIEREISGRYLSTLRPAPITHNGHKVAIVGAGPSGITMAIILARKGYDVTIIDSHNKMGGVMRYGIPEFRLPKHHIDRISAIMRDMGIKFKPNVFVGSNSNINDMLYDGYSAVFLAVGTSRPNKIGLLGETLGNCHYAVDYLASPNDFPPVDDVVVVGVGNVAIDAARTAMFNGAMHVTLINYRRECDVSCDKKELLAAFNEGIKMESLLATVRITDDAVTCVRVKTIENEDGTVGYEEDFSQIKNFKSDRTIIAIGQGPQSAAIATTNIEKNSRGLYMTDEYGRTQKKGVFAAGDVVTGPRNVVEAIAFTKKVATAIDEYCQGLDSNKPK